MKEIPASLFPLIWDFGTLDESAENKYITQMVKKSLQGQHQNDANVRSVVNVLQQSQAYMRSRKDECSFVSLRDVERTLIVLNWFLEKEDILELLRQRLKMEYLDFQLSLVLALGVSFYARLEDRDAYTAKMTRELHLGQSSFSDVSFFRSRSEIENIFFISLSIFSK